MRTNILKSLFCVALMALGFSACDYIHEDLEPCPTGINLSFRYNYNLQRADMFPDHVGSVTVYIYDENGNFLMKQTETNTPQASPLKQQGYQMYLDLKPGKYQYLVWAGQKGYEEQLAAPGAKFRITEPSAGSPMNQMAVTLDRESGANEGLVPHANMPLDTIWHGMRTTPIEVPVDKIIGDTVSLVRNTKQINITLREVDEPQLMDVKNYEFHIYDKNSRLLWNNEVDESKSMIYTPYALWNTKDKAVEGQTAGVMAHADFMTSRIIFHEKAKDDAVLSIKNKTTDVEVIRVNLADILSRLRISADIYRYTPQQFLDRGYDYKLTFFISGDRWLYVNVEISVLSWAVRIQNVDL